MIKFEGASVREGDTGKEYTSRGEIWINPDMVSAVYDHTILMHGNRIHVMEELNDILNKLKDGGGIT